MGKQYLIVHRDGCNFPIHYCNEPTSKYMLIFLPYYNLLVETTSLKDFLIAKFFPPRCGRLFIGFHYK